MKKQFFMGFLCLLALTAKSQDVISFNDYAPLKCMGDIPADFKVELSQMMNKVKSGLKTSDKDDRRREIEFTEGTAYSLNNILYGGKVLYGDRLTNYVNKVADNVLKKEPELRKQLRFYVLKDADPNAMTLPMGVIFIHIGLLAQVESEAQLAYIICHEAVHFRNHHSLERYNRRQELVTRKNRYLSHSDRKYLMNYGREHELEADREGLEIFMRSDYSSGDLNRLFDVMLYSYLPFDDIPFNASYFNGDSSYMIPAVYSLEEVKQITARTDVPDSMSSHPNIQTRRNAIAKLLASREQTPRLAFILTKEEFKIIQRIARCEIAIAHLEEGEYEQAFYVGYLLERIYGSNMFSDKVMCAALYSISKQKSYYQSLSLKREKDRDFERMGSEKTINVWELEEGESQNVFYFFYKIPARELSVVAARKMYECNELYRNSYFEVRFNSLVSDLVSIHGMTRESFLKTTPALSAMDTKKPGKKAMYYEQAFIPYNSDSLFSKSFIYHAEKKSQEDKRKGAPDYHTYLKKKEKLVEKYGEGLNASKFVMINPYYANVVYRYLYFDTFYYVYRVKNPAFRPVQEMEVENSLVSYTRTYAKELNVDVDILGGNQPADIETKRFNDFQQMINWSSERIALGEMNAFTFHDQFMQPYANTYGYLGFLYVANVFRTLEVRFVLFDLSTGETKLVYSQELKKAKGDGVQVRMMIYNILHRMRQEQPVKLQKLKKKYGINE